MEGRAFDVQKLFVEFLICIKVADKFTTIKCFKDG